jgi:hypothetical protein
MSRPALASALGVLAILWSRPVSAEELPKGKIGMIGGARQGLGALGGRFGLGPVWGIAAGWQPASTERRLSFGIGWSLVWGHHWPDDSTENSSSLSTREMSLGVKLRVLTEQASPLFLSTGVGVSLLRTSVPVPPDDERSYVGMYWSIGPEFYVLGRYLVDFEMRYGPFISGPGSLTLAFGLSFGSG